MKPALPLAALLALSLGGCTTGPAHRSDVADTAAAPGCPDDHGHPALAGPKVAEDHSTEMVKAVNTFCPVAGTDHVGKDNMTTRELTRQYKGETVGFCCEGCPPVWDAMPDAQKEKALKAAMASR